MSTELNIPFYVEGAIYPSNSTPSVKDIIAGAQKSGFTTAILGLYHIGRPEVPGQSYGDIVFNNTLIITNGEYVGDKTWPEMVNSMPAGDLTTVCASIGGGGVKDYATLMNIYNTNGNSFSGTALEKNFTVFKEVFPTISIIDMDCEETYDEPSFVAFCQMLIGIGFKITFCPYTYESFWVKSLQALETSHPGAVLWWNLQCYDGGGNNNPADWQHYITQGIPGFNTDKFIIAGDWTNRTPQQVTEHLSAFKGETCIGGGFIWTLDAIINAYPNDILAGMQAYVNAIKEAFEISVSA
ncbi:hypothetical protein NBRC110019_20880 [Neptunitalea chrysea]|uniref:Uncharacterized protein n=1 Tax=Neptunitalea chrysea TaxID=1647581 RepID=A0A9W6EWJ0_9FLAO|nr:hypothetical protein [Neptunitalea chrysea]GLB53048.1 hypothetical protein NBRC110019_20880 [Neptunitalea chrysea]